MMRFASNNQKRGVQEGKCMRFKAGHELTVRTPPTIEPVSIIRINLREVEGGREEGR